MTTQTLFKNFEGFSQILKEQSGKKGIWGVYTSNSNNLKIAKSKEKVECLCFR